MSHYSRFASKTLMRILPDTLKGEVEGLINQKTITLDLYEILGQCTWGKKEGKSLQILFQSIVICLQIVFN